MARLALVALCAPVLAVSLAGCATTGRPSMDTLPVQEYRGLFTSAPRESWFRPCDAAADAPAWWVTVTDRAVVQVDSAKAAGRLVAGRPTYVRWRAAVAPEGMVGPSGRGTPALLVREVIELQPTPPAGCGG